MKPGQTVFDQLFAEIAVVSLNKGKETLHPAPPHGVFPTSPDEEWSAQFFAGITFGQFTHFQILVDSNSEVSRLFFDTVPELGGRLRGVDEIQAKNVFLARNADVEAIAIVWSL